jgi:hypothetical protein
MTNSNAPNKFAKLKRTLTGGSLSAGFAGMNLLVLWLAHDSDSFILFGWPYFYAGLLGFTSGAPASLLVSLVIWFFLGAGSAFFVKSNKKAILLWLLPFSPAFLFAALVWVIIQKFTGV